MFGNNISLRCISFLLSFHFSIILSSPLSTYYYKHICLSFQLSRNPFIFLSINLTIYLSLYLFLFLSIYLFIYHLSSPPPSNIYFSVCQLTCLKKMYNWKKNCVGLLRWKVRNWVCATNSYFLISISLQLDVVDLRYFKL